jgi:hypothetical protein
MESAFGIDHGDIEKAFKLPGAGAAGRMLAKPGGAIGRGVEHLGSGVRSQGNKVFGAVRANPHPSAGFNQGARTIGAGYVKAGGKLQKAGQALQGRPGLTGGIAAGGLTAGAGGIAMNRRRQ